MGCELSETTETAEKIIEIPQPEPDLTPEELVRRAAGMRTWLRDHQDETEQRTGISEDTHKAFLEAGFYRSLQPRRFGGYEFDLRTYSRMVTEVARGCPSSGWNLCLAASHSLVVAGRFPESTQREVFGPDGDFRAPLPIAPSATATRTPDGYLVNGRWDYSSGVNVSTHFLGGVLIIDEEGGMPTPGMVLVPSGWRMLDNWGEILGFRGSGSNSVVAEDVLVPYEYVSRTHLLANDATDGPGVELHGNPMYAGRLMSFFNIQLCSVVAGTAWAAVDEYRRIITTKNSPMPPFKPRSHDPEHQRNLGLATALADSAQRIILSVTDDYTAYAARGLAGGEPFSELDDRALSLTARQSGQLACQAVEMLASASGSSALANGERMQRYLRDVATYKTHINAQHGWWATGYARSLLGVENPA
jgi:3-hydroxy-9,10-secoandrosta-1,3,5(10)-triene-9,17-dione monooxygenase